MIQRFMKPANEPKITGSAIRKIGSLEGQDLIDPDYDIDECNDEISIDYLGYRVARNP